MTTPGDRPRRSGFLASLSSALTPPVVTDDEPDKPLRAPTTVKVATVLTMLAGLLFLFLGVNSLVNLDRDLNTAVTAYTDGINKCTNEVGGIGDKVVTPAQGASKEQTDLAEQCKRVVPLTQEMKDNAQSRAKTVSWVLIVVGVAAIAIGWFLRTGAPWARRAAVGLVVLTMLLTMFLQISNLLTMLATLFVVAAVLMSYLGSGGVFFTRSAMRRRAA
jgi:hypothetical protein